MGKTVVLIFQMLRAPKFKDGQGRGGGQHGMGWAASLLVCSGG